MILAAAGNAGAETIQPETAIAVEVALAGAARDAIVRGVTPKLEDHLGAANGLKFMVSMSRAGGVRLVLKFEPGVAHDAALADVRTRLASALATLPRPGAPVVDVLEPAAQPVAYLAFSSDVESGMQITKVIEPWVGLLANTENVTMVHLHGSRMPIIRIEADASRLAAYGVSTAEVATALRLNRVSATPDFGSTDTSKLVIWPLIDRVNVEALGDIVLKLVAGSSVRLRDVAVVRLDAKDDGIVARFDGKAAIVAEVQKRPETDIVAATRAVRQRVADLEVQRPASIRIDAGYLCERCAEPAKH